MSVELKNCPFCGNSAKCVKSMEDSMFRIECWSDSCSSSSLRFEDREDAVTAWNKRAESEAEEEVARLRDALKKISAFQTRIFETDADEIEATQDIVAEALK